MTKRENVVVASGVTADDLREQHELAESLIAKLERIKALWAEMPNESETDDLERVMGNIEASAERIVETCKSDEFPCADDLDDLSKTCGSIVDNLAEIVELKGHVPLDAEDGAGE